MEYEVRTTETFDGWLDGLDGKASAVIAKRIVRISAGLLGDVSSLGDGVSEFRVHFGPGYRVYFTIRGRTVVILLCGGDKGSQSRDIAKAKEMAADLE